MRIIRAVRGIHVPENPESPQNSNYRAVQSGLLALVPDGYELPEDSFVELLNVNIAAEDQEQKGFKKKK